MMLAPAFLDELRARTLLSALIGKTVKLQRAGREYKACCPFHQEKTPSFTINDDKGFYHCFGCGAHGDAIRFLTDSQGLPFMEAVKELATAAGMSLPTPEPRDAERAKRAAGLIDATEAAARWFREQLGGIEGAQARAYLERRGVAAPLQEAFAMGFAPDSRGRLKAALDRFGAPMLVEAGLLIQVEEKEPYDRFRGRLMIPIRDGRGRTIAFGGRILGDGEPKYLNSPETPLFDKGRTLFNLDRAAPASRKAGRVIVVEGYMDVIALASAGIDEAVAPLGTALTEGQMERLWRLSDVPILCFDGDKAGQKAAVRAALRALPLIGPNRSLSFAMLPPGQDPDDLVRASGREGLEAVLAKAEPLVEHLWRHELAAQPLDTPEAKAGLRQRLNEQARAIGDAGVRDQYQAEFRRRFDALFRAPPPANRPPARRGPWRPGRIAEAPASREARSIGAGGVTQMLGRAVLAGILRHPAVLAAHAEALAQLAFADRSHAALRDALLEAAFTRQPLESAALPTILAEAGLSDVANGLRTPNGLAFSFLRGNADRTQAERDLAAAIRALAERPELDEALAAATKRLMASPDEAGFAEQRRARAARDEADRTLAALAQGDGGNGL